MPTIQPIRPSVNTVVSLAILLAALVAGSILVVTSDSHEGTVSFATTDSSANGAVWPARIVYTITTLPEPRLDAPLGEIRLVFEGAGFHSYFNYELRPDGTPGACTIRHGRDYLVSSNSCEGPYFDDDYGLSPGEERGANPYLRTNGGVPDADLRTSAEGDALSLQMAQQLGLRDEDTVTYRVSGPVHCHGVGLECDFEAEQIIEKVIHLPSRLLVFQRDRFDGQLINLFEVEEIVRDAPLPSRLRE